MAALFFLYFAPLSFQSEGMKKLFLLLCLLLISDTAHAEDRSAVYVETLKKVITVGPYETYAAQMLGLLDGQQFAALDEYYTSLQKSYEAGLIDDKTLAYAYEPFEEIDDPKYQKIYADWLSAMPKSYPAHYMHETYRVTLAWKARGKKFASKTSQSQFDSFGALLERAYSDNTKTLQLKLTQKPILSLMNRLRMLRAASSLNLSRDQARAQADATLKEANALDPNNFLARFNYMTILRPRWGGSYDEMKAFAKTVRAEKAPAKVADYMDAVILEDVGDGFYDSETYKRALPYYYKAAALQAPYYDYGNVEALKRYIYSTYRVSHETDKHDPNTKEFLTLLDTLLRPGRLIDNPGWYYGERAQTRWNVNNDAVGTWEDYQKGAYYGDAHSLFNVASIYCKGQPELQVAPDQKLCKSTMAKAALKGSKPAAQALQTMQP